MERRLAAIVAADVVGYSRLMGEDEPGTRLVAGLSLRGLHERARIAARELSRLQPTLDIAYIDDTYPFMLPQERERFVGALRAADLLET
jgi:hypothetical protein